MLFNWTEEETRWIKIHSFSPNALCTLRAYEMDLIFNDWVNRHWDSHRAQLNQEVQQIVHFHAMIFVFNPQSSSVLLNWWHFYQCKSSLVQIIVCDIGSCNFIWLTDIAISLRSSVVTINNFFALYAFPLWMSDAWCWCFGVLMLDRFRWKILSIGSSHTTNKMLTFILSLLFTLKRHFFSHHLLSIPLHCLWLCNS